MEERPEIVREARMENLKSLLQFIEDACHESVPHKAVCFYLRLAVEEVCVNLIRHGYAQTEPGPIRLNFQADEDQVIIHISDHAPPFRPEQAPQPDLESEWQDRPIGGLGWYLIRKLMDEIIYHSDPENGNVLTLVKRLPQEKGIKIKEEEDEGLNRFT